MKIFSSRLSKHILWVIVIMWCSWFFLNGYVGIGEVNAQLLNQWANWMVGGVPENIVNPSDGNQWSQTSNTNYTITPASSSSTSSSIDTMGLWQIMDMILKIIYLLLWPLLVLAGLALDNTLVYASIFHLDAPLWKFWNMMKNFANFALWFMVLFAIIKSILTNSGEWSLKDEKSPLGIIKTTLIAGILIQASRFLLAAVVDISTIATYAVGGLPLSVLKNTQLWTQKILSVNSAIDFNNFDVLNPQGEGFKVRYSTVYKNKDIKISPCKIAEWSSGTTTISYVVGRTLWWPEYENTAGLTPDYQWYNVCVINGSQLVMRKEQELMDAIQWDWMNLTQNTSTTTTPDYTTKEGNKVFLQTLTNFTGRVNKPYIINYAVRLWSGSQEWLTKWDEFFSGSMAMTISDLIKKSKGFVGPLVTIYSSLLDFAQLTDTSVTSIGETSWVFIIKSLVAIALFFPLLALAVVLIARIGVLWLYIVASPFIVIKSTFKLKLGESLDKYLDINNVLGIVFAPVVTVAALSISLIFMTALVSGFSSNTSSQDIANNMGIQKIEAISTPKTDYDAINVMGVAQMEFTKLPWWEWLDRFSWFMVNLFAIGLMWMIVFAAIKANILGEKIGQKIQDFWQNTFRTLPILPIGPDGAGVGIGSAASVVKRLPDTWIQNRENNQEAKVRDWIDSSSTKNKFVLDNNKASAIVNAKGSTFEDKYAAAGYTMPTGATSKDFNTETNKDIVYDVVSNTAGIDTTAELKKYESVFGTEWRKAEAIERAEAKIKTTITNTIKDETYDINNLNLKDDATKKILKEYFNAKGNSPYTQKIGTKTLTITPLTQWATDYTATFDVATSPIPTTTPTNKQPTK